MKGPFVYETYSDEGLKLDTSNDLCEVPFESFKMGNRIEVYDGRTPNTWTHVHTIKSQDQLEEWMDKLARDFSWKPSRFVSMRPELMMKAKVEDAELKVVFGTNIPLSPVNPSHYQGFVGDLQWLETKMYHMSKDQFDGAMYLQVDRYLSRLGKKDATLQEMEKALWYLKFWTAWKKNGQVPILVKDVDDILKRNR
jgi:hypothetical protein